MKKHLFFTLTLLLLAAWMLSVPFYAETDDGNTVVYLADGGSGDGGEQPGFVAEVVCRRGVGDPGPSGQITQAQLGRARLAEDGDRGSEDGLAQVAVVVGANRGHAPTVAAG